ncbi:tyrosinase [Geosmithia morbida]|uniref:tyrosinase n=1 Tax=Geosmithia morbida TaxID=1094350 RepID=A0A9P4YZ08_9HYPO|nr:tyrosinase [Geosmithia morbida]KAF4124361.1 tyrosinase [Geosmithia morbida]
MRAADQLRSPFWDWAADMRVPPVTASQTLTINISTGNGVEESEVENPLWTFRFPRAALESRFGEGQWDPDNNNERTFRCVEPGESYPRTANELLAERPYQSWLYNCFTRAQTFSQFASTGDIGMSLEQIHNGVHWDAACKGQFLSSEFSAFDPLFMLHHTNVDRLWAYWQVIHPSETMFHESYEGGARFSTREGTVITPRSPLHPFFASEDELHTPTTVDSIEDFGYTYEGLEYWEKSREQMAQNARRIINRQYGPGNRELKRRDGKPVRRYSVAIEVEVDGLERPCSVELTIANHFVGNFVVMKQPRSGILYGSFPLHDILKAVGSVKRPLSNQGKPLDGDGIFDAIVHSFDISIVKPNGAHIPLSTVRSLKIELEDVLVTPPTSDDQFPTYGIPRRRPLIAVQRQPTATPSSDLTPTTTTTLTPTTAYE